MARLRPAPVVAPLLALALLATACAGDPEPTSGPASATAAAATTKSTLRLTFDDTVGPEGSLIPRVESSGTAPVRIEIVTQSGGRLVREQGPWRDAGRFPTLDRDRAAAVVVRSAGVNDALSPGVRDFRMGADFRLDARSDGLPTDDGDNLLQRGLFTGPAQYKLQLDDRRPACRVAGSDGAVLARVPARVEPDQWYRMTCFRDGDRLVLQLLKRDADGWRSLGPWIARGRIGLVRLSRSTPLSIGAKTLAGGEIVRSSTDQLNGAVDNVFFKLL